MCVIRLSIILKSLGNPASQVQINWLNKIIDDIQINELILE